MPLTYLRNRARTAAVGALERLANQRTRSARATEWWAPEGHRALEHPELKGLWLLRQAVGPEDVATLRALARRAIHPAAASSTSGTHFELAAADRECDLMLSKLRELPAGSDGRVDAAEATEAALQRRDALRVQAEHVPPPPPPLRTPVAWEWFEYEPGRSMAPMRPHDAEERCTCAATQQRHLEGFEVFDRAPVEQWLCLRRLTDSLHGAETGRAETGGAIASHGAVSGSNSAVSGTKRGVVVDGFVAGGAEVDTHSEALRGAASLRRLQTALPDRLPGAIGADCRCVFFQWQELERGTCVAPHVDADTPPADTVVTLSLGRGASDSVRIGHVAMEVLAGDVYAISGPARWDVEHEVHCSTSDRLSLTLRFASEASLGGTGTPVHR